MVEFFSEPAMRSVLERTGCLREYSFIQLVWMLL